MNKKILILLCFILLVTGTSCSDKDVIEENNSNVKKINELESRIENLQKQVDEYKTSEESLQEEKEYYLDFIKDLTDSMTPEYLLHIAKEQWKYTVMVDEVPIPSNGIMEIEANTFKLTVTEEQAPYTALPIEIHNKGRISGNLFSNHIEFLDSKPSVTEGSDGTVVSSTTYTFTKLQENDIVNLRISPELQERLGLETNLLTIKTKELGDEDTPSQDEE